MLEVIYLSSHIGITLIAVVAIALRIEHRLTKIEMDVTWLIVNSKLNCGKENEDEVDKEVG